MWIITSLTMTKNCQNKRTSSPWSTALFGLFSHIHKLVWTLRLMHRCVCIWRYILQITTTNYISKTSLYTTFHMYPLRPWLLKMLMFTLLMTCEIATYSWPSFAFLHIAVSVSGQWISLGWIPQWFYQTQTQLQKTIGNHS